MRNFFSDRKNIIICALVFILVLVTAFGCILFTMQSNTIQNQKRKIEKKDAIITSADAQAEADANKIQEQQAQIDNITGQNEALTSENNVLKEQLAAKKEAASKAIREAERKAAEAASAERTKAIIAALSLPQTQQATALPNVCYLTFDDGPSDVTLSILNTLATYNVKATFFVKGTSKIQYLPNIAAAGHTIGLHTNSHNYNNIYSSVENYLADLQAISQKVEATTGVKSSVVRFPGGSSNTVSKICPGIMTQLTTLLPEMGYSYFDWNVSSGDAETKKYSAAQIANFVISRSRGKQSVCVLMHDAGDKRTTAEALPAIIEGLFSLGFRFDVLTPQTFGYHQKVAN